MVGWAVVVIVAVMMVMAAVVVVDLLRLWRDSNAAQKMKWKTRGGLLGTASGGQTLRHRCE